MENKKIRIISAIEIILIILMAYVIGWKINETCDQKIPVRSYFHYDKNGEVTRVQNIYKE